MRPCVEQQIITCSSDSSGPGCLQAPDAPWIIIILELLIIILPSYLVTYRIDCWIGVHHSPKQPTSLKKNNKLTAPWKSLVLSQNLCSNVQNNIFDFPNVIANESMGRKSFLTSLLHNIAHHATKGWSVQLAVSELSNEMLESIRSIGFARFSMAFCFWPSPGLRLGHGRLLPSLLLLLPCHSHAERALQLRLWVCPEVSLHTSSIATCHCCPAWKQITPLITSEQWKFRESSHKLHLSLQGRAFHKKNTDLSRYSSACQELAVLILNGACPNVRSLPDPVKHESCQVQLRLKRPSCLGLCPSRLAVQQSDSRFSDS